MIDAVHLLRGGEVLVIFPEAYPNVDPSFTPKAGADAFLPFRAGVTRLVELAERDGTTHVQIVPAGLAYHQEHGQHMHCLLRLGAPLSLATTSDKASLLRAIEEQVHALSAPLSAHPASPSQRSAQAVQV